MILYAAQLPFAFLKFWFLQAPVGLLSYFRSVNSAFIRLSSLPLLIRTYFKPWKNEYRKGLIGFSIGMGMFIKTCAIFANVFFLLLLVCIEISFLLLFLLWPIATVAFLLGAL